MTPAEIALCRLALALLAVAATRRRPVAGPLAAALVALVTLDGLRLLALPARAHLAVWLVWPGVSAALSWRAWSRSRAGVVVVAFAATASGLAWAPWSWALHPVAYAVVLKSTYVASAALSGAAWVARRDSRKGEGLRTGERLLRSSAAVLAWSGAVDLLVGVLAVRDVRASYALAWPLSAVTWVVLAGLIVRELPRRP